MAIAGLKALLFPEAPAILLLRIRVRHTEDIRPEGILKVSEASSFSHTRIGVNSIQGGYRRIRGFIALVVNCLLIILFDVSGQNVASRKIEEKRHVSGEARNMVGGFDPSSITVSLLPVARTAEEVSKTGLEETVIIVRPVPSGV